MFDEAAVLGYLDHALHEGARQMDVVGIEVAEIDELLGLDDRRSSRHRHRWREMAARPVKTQVAEGVGLARSDESEVGGQGVLEQVAPAIDLPELSALRHHRAHAGV